MIEHRYSEFSTKLFTHSKKWLLRWNIILRCFTFIFIFVSCSQQPNTIKGYVEGLTNDTVFVLSISLNNFGRLAVSDTVFAKNGRFEYKFPNDGAYDLLITFPQFSSVRSNGDTYIPETSSLHVFVEPDDKISFECCTNSAGIESVNICGSKLNVDYSTIQNKLYEIFRNQLEIASALDRAIANNDKEAETIGQAKIRERYRVRDKLYINYVRANLQNPISAFLLCFLPVDSVGLYYDKLGENVRSSIFHQMLDREMERYTRYNNAVDVGEKAPDFTLEDLDGKLFSLSSLLGREKYVIIDFWGTWCAPCITGIPKMKSLYEKYTSQLEIIGVACDESSVDVWQDAVKQYELPWINVYNDNPSLVNVKYGIKGYPTKIVIDPEGTILVREVGEREDFYTKLEALLNKY